MKKNGNVNGFSPKRPDGAHENGEINVVDAFQQEIWCSWPELFFAPSEIADRTNVTGGYLRISNPGMGLHEFAEKCNELKRLRLIPGSLRPQDLLWDGQDCRVLSAKLAKLLCYGSVDLWHLPGYETGHPAVLTADIAANCYLADTVHGRAISALTGRIASLSDVETWEDTAKHNLRRYAPTPATVAKAGVLLHGVENMPDKSVILRKIPDTGPARITARCPFCGMLVAVGGDLLDGQAHYEVDTYPRCDHLRLEIQHHDAEPYLAVVHIKIPEKHRKRLAKSHGQAVAQAD